jgi:hypothetical protein
MKLDADDRRGIPSSQFGLPTERKYPMPDASHAQNAKARASEEYNKGALSGSQKAQIDRKADAKLGDSPRTHSLTMASATHLHKAGYISSAHHAAIKADAQKRLAVHKARKPAAYGSMAPQSAGHYMSTTANMDQDQDGI